MERNITIMEIKMARRAQVNAFQMTYKLAAKLRDHGYPQPTHNAKSPGGIFYPQRRRAYGPPFAELFKALGAIEFITVSRVGPACPVR